ncbi:HNH endonuclease signature motif containing protein [Mycobacterium sp.]|jgi:hypothetical protein|uniref:HNH endonuclease signature motif containing protein n=1 Tax=Mycobacterium sp. TaxID=1785 RepID=UPI002D4122B1|nr:HNH endonuclease signature motif containing protein [Mycobacterium sp.]HZA10134.1 HNH endonuclease signature motif containing protein [Mycobacterium sp.]
MCEAAVDLSSATDAGVVDAMAAAARKENAACAERLAALGELWARRASDHDDERMSWAIDGFEDVVAEAGVALGISRGRAAGQLRYAIALRERLPKVAEVFRSGVIDFRIMSTIVSRTDNVDDAEQLARVDAALARHVAKWTRLSQPKLDARIDMWVAKFDPAGVRLPNQPTDDRYVHIWANRSGMADVSALIATPDAVVLDDRLDQLAASVCDDDPRTKEQRRADALVALAANNDRLACRCGSDNCPAGGDANPLGDVVIHVLAEQATLDGGDTPGYVTGFGTVPAQMVRDMASSAKLTPLPTPSPIPESGYRPSSALAAWVQARDLTCRFPGCDKPAEVCDIDHTVPWPQGPTHPSNLKLLCRGHHLLKTFYTGPNGWADRQLPDGTVIWTAPTGHIYTTQAEGAVWLPTLARPTGELIIPNTTGPPAGLMAPARGLMMPRRKRTRRMDRQYRINHERRVNEARLAEEAGKYRAWIDDDRPPW